jgi:hypothetical protein
MRKPVPLPASDTLPAVHTTVVTAKAEVWETKPQNVKWASRRDAHIRKQRPGKGEKS